MSACMFPSPVSSQHTASPSCSVTPPPLPPPLADGITDLEAVESSQGADLFIGYGGWRAPVRASRDLWSDLCACVPVRPCA